MKKLVYLFTLLLSMAMVCTGCQNTGENNGNNTEVNTQQESENGDVSVNTEDIENTEESVLTGTHISVGDTLEENEIVWFENYFFNTDENRMPNMFLSSEYAAAADVDLGKLFYGGVDGKGGVGEVSEDEIQLLVQKYDIMELDTSKATVEEMNAVLQKYMGITLEESNKLGLDSLYYLEETDAYYNVAGDTVYMKCDIVSGQVNADGTITLVYCDALSEPSDNYQVTLKEVDGGYIFISNVKVVQ
ncbi:MAG: hypothetical protein IJO60_05520 [Agathobacter sp.]|nr:hypothetical protein [Agathobacter sp.]